MTPPTHPGATSPYNNTANVTTRDLGTHPYGWNTAFWAAATVKGVMLQDGRPTGVYRLSGG